MQEWYCMSFLIRSQKDRSTKEIFLDHQTSDLKYSTDQIGYCHREMRLKKWSRIAFWVFSLVSILLRVLELTTFWILWYRITFYMNLVLGLAFIVTFANLYYQMKTSVQVELIRQKKQLIAYFMGQVFYICASATFWGIDVYYPYNTTHFPTPLPTSVNTNAE